MRLTVEPIKTEVFHPGDNLADFIALALQSNALFQESQPFVLAVTSKIISLAEGRLVAKSTVTKEALVRKEADYFFSEAVPGCYLTIKHNLFIPSAGIDESNSENGNYILFPADPFKSAKNLHRGLADKWRISGPGGPTSFGIIITDSRPLPLRKGVVGTSVAHYGFEAVKPLQGVKDLFGRALTMTSINIADALASAAVLTMGEASESTPLAIIRGGEVKYCLAEKEWGPSSPRSEVEIPWEQDLYYTLYKSSLHKEPR